MVFAVTAVGEAVGALPEGTADELEHSIREEWGKIKVPDTPPVVEASNGVNQQVGSFHRAMTGGAKMYADAWGRFMKAQQEIVAAEEQKRLGMQQRAAEIVAQNMTPDETFAKAIEELGDLVIGDFLSDAQADREVERLRASLFGPDTSEADEAEPETGSVGVAQAGSAEAFSAIVAAMREARGGSGKSPEVKATEKNTEAVKDVGKAIEAGTTVLATVEEF